MRYWIIPVAFATLPGTASGQTDRLRVGGRVRLSVPSVSPAPVVGHITSRSADSLFLRTSGIAPVQYAVPLREIQAAAVSRHERLVPGLIGGVIGGAVCYPLYNNVIRHVSIAGGSTKYRSEVAKGTCAATAVVGAGIGALVGRERWERIQLQPGVVVTGGDRAAQLVIRVRF